MAPTVSTTAGCADDRFVYEERVPLENVARMAGWGCHVLFGIYQYSICGKTRGAAMYF